MRNELFIKVNEFDINGRSKEHWLYTKSRPTRRCYWLSDATKFPNTEEGLSEAKEICDILNRYPTVRQACILTAPDLDNTGNFIVPTIVYPK